MIVKVGDVLYDGSQEPVMVIVSEREKTDIGTLAEGETLYASYPARLDQERVLDWMHGRIGIEEVEGPVRP